MIYFIFHPSDGIMNHDCIPGQFEYQQVFHLEASSLEEAFKLSQNDFNPEYAALNIRSTSVGDIIQPFDKMQKGLCMLVQGIGFLEVPSAWLRFIDWGKEDARQREEEVYWDVVHSQVFQHDDPDHLAQQLEDSREL